MPIPIQAGPITDRLRKFFRIRGRVVLALDEIVAPVCLVQDLTKGPYQSGVSPCAGSIAWQIALAASGSVVIVLNDKLGSLTPVLGPQFKGRSFSLTWAEMQNTNATDSIDDLRIQVVDRAAVLATGVPTASAPFFAIQEGDGKLTVPVELFAFDAAAPAGGGTIWTGILGDNQNTLGSRRTMEPEPNVTIGPSTAVLIRNLGGTPAGATVVFVSVRGFYQQQPD